MPDQHLTQVRESLKQQQANVDQQLSELNVADQARLLSELKPGDRQYRFEQVKHPAQVLEFLPLDQQLQIANQLTIEQLASVLNAMHSDDFIDLYKQLPIEKQQQLLSKLSVQAHHSLKVLHAYPEETAGALMSSDYVTLSPELTMHEAIATLRDIAGNHDTLYLIYIVDAEQHLVGVISLRQIVQAQPTATIAEVMTREVIYGTVDED